MSINTAFWNEVLNDNPIIIDGRAFTDGGIETNPMFLRTCACDGAIRKVRMKATGEIILTNNLWFRGEIPSELEIEDNAEFLPVTETMEDLRKWIAEKH